MEIASFQKSPEDLLSGTLNDLSTSLNDLKARVDDCSRSIASLFDGVPDSSDEQLIIVEELLQASKIHIHNFYLIFNDYSEVLEQYRALFGFYKQGFEFWTLHESHLQRISEEFRKDGESVICKLEESVSDLKKLIKQANKSLIEIQERAEFELQQNEIDNEKRKRKHISCVCIVLWFPRFIRRCCRRCSRATTRSTSYETLVRQKSLPRESIKAGIKKNKQRNEDRFEINDEAIPACEILINGMRDVTNGMSYVHQELCRLDYLDANKEQHYEIMEKSADNLIELFNLVNFRLNKAECSFSKIINETSGEIQ